MYKVKRNIKQRYFLFFTIICIASLSFLSCNSSTSEQNPYSITLIGTADLQGLMEPHNQMTEINGTKKETLLGGISKISSILKHVKHLNPLGTFLVSSGDDLMGRYFHTFKGEAIYTLMSQSQYALYAPGNHEFDKGAEVFSSALEHAKFDTICSDLMIENTALEGKCLPYKIVNTKDIKIGFFSLMTEEFPLVTSAGKVKLKADNLTIAKNMVHTLQNEKCDIIVAITHIGLEQDKLLAHNLNGIDVIFGGHSHDYTKELVRVNNTFIINGGEEGSYVVKLDLPLNSKHQIDKKGATFELIPVTDSIVSDEDVQLTLNTYKAQLPGNIILGNTTVSWDLRTDTLREGESNVPDLVNDLLKEKFRVDIVMNNAGAFKGKKVYPPGDITDTMLHEIDEFSNNAYMMQIKGKYIRQILEHSATQYGRGGLMQISGIHYTIDLTQQAQIIKQNDDASWSIEQAGKRIVYLKIEDGNGTLLPLEDEKLYHVLSNAYLVNHAGDGYFWFGKYGISQKNTYTTFYTIMSSYVEKYTTLNPKALDGRLKILNK